MQEQVVIQKKLIAIRILTTKNGVEVTTQVHSFLTKCAAFVAAEEITFALTRLMETLIQVVMVAHGTMTT